MNYLKTINLFTGFTHTIKFLPEFLPSYYLPTYFLYYYIVTYTLYINYERGHLKKVKVQYHFKVQFKTSNDLTSEVFLQAFSLN